MSDETVRLVDDRPGPPPDGSRFDAVTFSFGDLDRDLFGMLRLQVRAGARPALAGVAIACHEGRQVLGVGDERRPPGEAGDWDALSTAGISLATRTPLAEWIVRCSGSCELELRFRALREPLRRGGGGTVTQPCAVSGAAVVEGRALTIDCLGQRDHGPLPASAPPVEVRELDAWLDPELAIAVHAERRPGAHAEQEQRTAHVLEDGVTAIADPRLSMTFDGAGVLLRAGLELWPSDEDLLARRAVGEVICAARATAAGARLQCAFLRWRMEGHAGAGRYLSSTSEA